MLYCSNKNILCPLSTFPKHRKPLPLQVFFNILWLISLLKSYAILRQCIQRDGKHVTILYMQLVNNVWYALYPLLVYKNYYMNFNKIKKMLDVVSCCPLLQDPIKFWVFCNNLSTPTLFIAPNIIKKLMFFRN